MSKIIFVIPWYGKDATGGAETLCKTLAEHLNQSELDIEIYTTCSSQFQSEWKNDFKPGQYSENGVPVKRFKVDPRNKELFNSINQKILSSQKISLQEENDFFLNNINSKDLLNEIKNDSTSIFVFIPYLYGTTFFGCQIHPYRSMMIPCLHDEGYAKMKLVKKVMSEIGSLAFNSLPEKQLASLLLSKLPHNEVLGVGINFPDHETKLNDFKEKYNLNNFILCAGRKESGKNTDLLINYFCKYLEQHNTDLKLVLTGKGNIEIPKHFSKNILDLYLSREELYDAFSAATFLCSPSINESFSIVLMESWINKTPVLVHKKSNVTKSFCEESNGGLYFETYDEFATCVDFFLEQSEIREKMAENGFEYVNKNFLWENIVQKYTDFFNSL